ncbi:MAG TPA: 4'-phosphopantetheinyl transferase superfamily protein [Stellaceae bacterium]|nr:4'-phosphopantetheinyl transferase superfamily protein [Stellaceae bacterium]
MGGAVDALVYYARVPSDAAAGSAAFQHLLDEDERRRSKRFHFERDRLIFSAAHALLRAALVARLGDWQGGFRVDDFSKPELEPPVGMPVLRFNLTHTRGLVGCALVDGCDIGIDAEQMDASRPLLELAEHYFAEAEITQLRAADGASRAISFYRFWTLKEAIIKAIGEGLSLPLKRFAFTLEPLSLTIEGGDAREWHVEECRALPEHAMAIALRRPPGAPVGVSWREARFVRDAADRVRVALDR